MLLLAVLLQSTATIYYRVYVLLLNNFIRNHSHTGTSTISDSKSCASITHSHKPAPSQSHAGNTTSGHNGTPIPNRRAANLSLNHKPNPNHSPTRRPPTQKHAQHYNHAPNSALEHCPTRRHIPYRSCLPPTAAECNHRPVLDRTPARSSALDYSLSRKPALSHYPTRDSILDLNLALNLSSKTPYKYGFKIIDHCEVNNLKPTRCHSIKDVRDIFNLFIEKLNSIKQLCPFTKVIVSPILPTGLRALNNRIGYFNRLLFNVPNWWAEIPIYSFLDKDWKLADIYRSYHNKNDDIHLGAVGIRSLVAKVKDALSRVDGRSYASVINGCHFTNRP